MHILLTRPIDDSIEMIEKFKSLGHDVSHLPLLNIEKVKMKILILIITMHLYFQVLIQLNFGDKK